MRLAIIPARGGSKRIPRKNIKNFCGQPIIAYSIQSALNSELFDKVVVSTDDEEIAHVAKQYGAEVPFIRPDELSDDFTGTVPVIKHAFLESEKVYACNFSEVCCIYATSPFIQQEYLRKGLELLTESDSAYTFSATEYNYPIHRSFFVNEQGRASMFYPEEYQTRSQDLTPAYHDAGQFYWGLGNAYMDEIPLIGSDSSPVLLPSYLVQDIDTMDDWRRAELIYNALFKK